MLRHWAAIVLAALLLSACSGGYARAPIATSPASAGGFRTPDVLRGSGLDSVIGRDAASLAQRFGEARLDLSEGDVRKLQYVSEGCVLDIFLYPLEANAAPVATHVEARRRKGGGETDRARCIDEVARAADRR